MLPDYLAIAIHPRRTLGRILRDDPNGSILILSGLAGAAWIFAFAVQRSWGARMDLAIVLGAILLLGPLLGILLNAFGGALLHGMAQIFGGQGDILRTRAALAWSTIPFLPTALLYLLALLIYGPDVFRGTILDDRGGDPLAAFRWLSALFVLWAAVVGILCVSRAQRFEIWRGLLTILLSGLTVGILMFGLFFAAALARGRG